MNTAPCCSLKNAVALLALLLGLLLLALLALGVGCGRLGLGGCLRRRCRCTPLGGVKADTNRFFKDLREALLRQCGALEVLDSADRLCNGRALLGGDWLLSALLERGDSRLLLAQIELGADQNDGRAVGVLLHLGVPLCSNRLEARRRKQTKTQEKNICSRIRQRPQRVEFIRT